ncbi:hypothetical protein NUW58_g6584 [Xylaria curta]|uniref:Uncharacterized protein n=1 Tax=Xylaria curta TaxID=42375 RepID=A0ACC1NSH1_9PEZI|nr:hypothetical protein NUW58_g6584 [Xylaria curta]
MGEEHFGAYVDARSTMEPRKEKPARYSTSTTTTTDTQDLSYTLDDTNTSIYESHYRPQKRSKRKVQQCSKRKGAASRFSKALTGLWGAFLDYVSPAHNGTSFVEDKQWKRAATNMMCSDPGPWHEYARLDSDTEDENPNPRCLKRKTEGAKSKRWIKRLANAIEDSLASQGAVVGAL